MFISTHTRPDTYLTGNKMPRGQKARNKNESFSDKYDDVVNIRYVLCILYIHKYMCRG